MPTLPLDPEDPREVGPYALLARLGEGGMGVVYLAQGPPGRVALKVVRRLLAADETFRTRFRREVLAARRVHGRGAVELLDADTEGERPYLAMAYVDGPTLLEAVTRDGPMEGGRLQALTVALAEAIATIHRAGVTHRDLKPSNVLLAEDQPVVVDFGVATATEATSITVIGTIMGSPGWMAPEQVTGGTTTSAMDIFAWGSLVTWAATGHNPFGSGRPDAVAYRIIHEEPQLDGVPDDLRPIVAATLAKDPTARPGADELLARLLHLQPQAEPEQLAADATALLARTWVQTPAQPMAALPPPGPPPPVEPPGGGLIVPEVPRGAGRWRRVTLVAAVLLVSAAVGLAVGYGVRELQDGDGSEDQAGADDEPPDTTTTTTTTIPTIALSVRWVIADDASRSEGDSCVAADPHDDAATITVEDEGGTPLADPVEAGEGVAEIGDGILDDVLGLTTCVYTLTFDAVVESDTYVLVPDTGDDPISFTADEVDANGGRLELVTDTGLF